MTAETNLEPKPQIYTSLKLEKQVRIWIANKKIGSKIKIKPEEVDLKNLKINNSQYTSFLLKFMKELQNKNLPVKKFDFNKDSVTNYVINILPINKSKY